MLVGVLVGVLTGMLVGCRASAPASFRAADPASRIRAVLAGVQRPDPSALAGMVEALGSDDAGLRTLAIAALERTTGMRFGYDPWDPPGQRRRAQERWRQWLAERTHAGHRGIAQARRMPDAGTAPTEGGQAIAPMTTDRS